MQPGIPGFFLVPKLRLCLSRTPFMQFCHAPADQSIIETDPAFFANRTQDPGLPSEGLVILANAHTAAVASPYSHTIQLFALR